MIRFVNRDVDVATERTLQSMSETDEYMLHGISDLLHVAVAGSDRAQQRL